MSNSTVLNFGVQRHKLSFAYCFQVLSTFYKSILRSPKDEDEMVVLQLVSFMLDFYAEILSPPENIKTQVSDRLKVLQNPQVSISLF